MGWQHQPARGAQERGGGVFTIPGQPGPESAVGVTPPFSAQVSQEQSSSKGSEDSWSRGGDWVCVGQAVPLTGHSSVVSLSTCLPLPPELAGPQRLRTDSPISSPRQEEAGTLATGAVSIPLPGLLHPRPPGTPAGLHWIHPEFKAKKHIRSHSRVAARDLAEGRSRGTTLGLQRWAVRPPRQSTQMPLPLGLPSPRPSSTDLCPGTAGLDLPTTPHTPLQEVSLRSICRPTRVGGGGSPGGCWGAQRRKGWRPGGRDPRGGGGRQWLRPEHPQTHTRLVAWSHPGFLVTELPSTRETPRKAEQWLPPPPPLHSLR